MSNASYHNVRECEEALEIVAKRRESIKYSMAVSLIGIGITSGMLISTLGDLIAEPAEVNAMKFLVAVTGTLFYAVNMLTVSDEMNLLGKIKSTLELIARRERNRGN